MSRHRLLTPLALAATLLAVSACSSDSPTSDPTPSPATSGPTTTSDPATTTSPEVTAAPEVPSLPVVSEVFDKAKWGETISQVRGKFVPPVVAGRHLVVLEEGTVRALDPQREHDPEAWSETWEPFEQSAANRAYPVLRQVSPDVVALVDVGKRDGDKRWSALVTLRNIEDGELIEEVTLDGTESAAPELGRVGLGFRMPSGPPQVVLPDGTVQKAPAVADRTVDDAITVGGVPVSLWQTRPGVAEPRPGFGTEAWTSTDLTPNPEYTRADVFGGSPGDFMAGRWAQPSASVGGEITKQAVQIVNVNTGRVTASLACVPDFQSENVLSISLSPDRSRGVVGAIRIDRAGNGECKGEEERNTKATFTAITDSGRAFGTATGPGSPRVFVELSPEGQTKRHDLTQEGINPPVGVLAGDLAVHWDGNSGIVTVNPIKPPQD